MIQTFVRLLNVDTGFQSDGVLTMEVALPRTVYPGQRPAEFFDRLVTRLSAVPGVDTVAATSSVPLAGTENLRQVTVEGRPRPEPGKEIIADFRVVTSEYFRAMGIPHVAGDALPRQPGPESPRVLLINSMMADTVFAGESPLGRRLKMTSYDQDAPWYTIAGVVGDTRHTALDSAVRPQIYVHQNVEPSLQMIVVLRTRDDPAGYAPVARAAVHELDANQPAGRIRTMKAVVSDAVARQRFTMFLAGVFAALALVLSLVGLYAVVSYSVAERTQELGREVRPRRHARAACSGWCCPTVSSWWASASRWGWPSPSCWRASSRASCSASRRTIPARSSPSPSCCSAPPSPAA